MTDFHEALGAGPDAGTLHITVFIPSVDNAHQPIGQEVWVDACLRVFGELFRGATAFPPGRGVWRNDSQGGELVFDDTVLVTTYVDPAIVTEGRLARLREFLHRLGRETGQGEVGVIMGGHYFGITDYDAKSG